jgi:hypothetical protein
METVGIHPACAHILGDTRRQALKSEFVRSADPLPVGGRSVRMDATAVTLSAA